MSKKKRCPVEIIIFANGEIWKRNLADETWNVCQMGYIWSQATEFQPYAVRPGKPFRYRARASDARSKFEHTGTSAWSKPDNEVLDIVSSKTRNSVRAKTK
jgi:hypothetical protein